MNKKTIYDVEMPKIVPFSTERVQLLQRDDLGDGVYGLYVNGIQWMMSPLDLSHSKDTQYSQFDLAYGDVLISGLGFGIIAKALVQNPEVRSVTVLEVEKEIIDRYIQINGLDEKLIILNEDALVYSPAKKYDCLFPDHYEKQDINWIISDMNKMSKRVNHDVYWPWSIEQIFFKKEYLDTPEKMKSRPPAPEFLKNNSKDFYQKWQEFLKKYFPDVKTIPDLPEEKLIEYLEKYVNHIYPPR